jgi:hypothetical protein
MTDNENADININPETYENEDNLDELNTQNSPQPQIQTERATPVRRLFPQDTLEDALVVVRTLKDYNGGNPWTGEEIANVLRRSAKASDFYYLTAASRDYGLTEGTSRTKSIEITSLGREYLFAASPVVEKEALQKAFFNVLIFKEVYEYYSGSHLPDMKYLKNTLEGNFKLDKKFHEEFYKIYLANCRFIDNIAPASSTTMPPVKREVISLSTTAGTTTSTELIRAFVIMPLSEKTQVYPSGFYNEVLVNLIIPAAQAGGFTAYTARKDGSDIIHSTIIDNLMQADLVIADLTEHNPNVLFELGFRMAEDKPVALIRARGTAPVFDVDNMLRVWDYNPNLWKSTLENDVPALTRHLEGTWQERQSARTYKRILLGQPN